MDEIKATRIIDSLIDMPIRKVGQISCTRSLVSGLWGTLLKYNGIEPSPELLALMKDRIGVKLEGSEETDYEWSETQWEATMMFDPFRDEYE